MMRLFNRKRLITWNKDEFINMTVAFFQNSIITIYTKENEIVIYLNYVNVRNKLVTKTMPLPVVISSIL